MSERIWHVTVQNMTANAFEPATDPFRRVACKFTVTSMPGLSVEEFEHAMTLELISAIRKIKQKMIMEGIEP